MSAAQARSLARATALCAVLCAALFALDRWAVRRAPSDAALVATVRERAGTAAARRALFALVLREAESGRTSAALDEALRTLAPADERFIAAYRPDLLRRGGAR